MSWNRKGKKNIERKTLNTSLNYLFVLKFINSIWTSTRSSSNCVSVVMQNRPKCHIEKYSSLISNRTERFWRHRCITDWLHRKCKIPQSFYKRIGCLLIIHASYFWGEKIYKNLLSSGPCGRVAKFIMCPR
jgi:hypothetical protein